jgi:hypothetical protein
MPDNAAEYDAPCQHAHVERREKFDGTPYWVCLDCGADSWEGPPRVIPPDG